MKDWRPFFKTDTGKVVAWIAVFGIGGLVLSFLIDGSPSGPPPPSPTPKSGSDWWPLILALALELLSKPVFWICLCLLWAATIISNSIDTATRTLSRRLQELTRRFRSRTDHNEHDDDFFDDDP